MFEYQPRRSPVAIMLRPSVVIPSLLPPTTTASSSRNATTTSTRTSTRTTHSTTTATTVKKFPPALVSLQDLTLARKYLHVSAVPDSLPCREEEYREIKDHVTSLLLNNASSCIYISGVPGTGKTATVYQVIRALQTEATQNLVPEFDLVEINGMKLTDPQHAYVILFKELTGRKVSPNQATILLEKRFSHPSPTRKYCVVIMDELDQLVTKKQTVIYNFFDWPNRKQSNLIVIAIANTMDLPERLLSQRISSRLGLTRITFEPYNQDQLIQIVHSRLKGSAAMDADAIELCARKVGAVSGDARRVLEICRRACELAEDNFNKNPSTTGTALVTMHHINAALKEMILSTNVFAIQNASFHEQLVLCCLYTELSKNGNFETTFGTVCQRHTAICRMYSFSELNNSQLASVVRKLAEMRLILLEGGEAEAHHRIRLNIPAEDIQFSLRGDATLSKILQS